MALYDPTRNFLFTHIWRTGGGTLRELIISPDSVEIGASHARFDAVSQRLELAELQPRPFCFTIVRNPFDWLVSVYEVTRKHPNHPDHQHAQNGFGEWLRFIVDERMTPCDEPFADHWGTQHEVIGMLAATKERVFRFEDLPWRYTEIVHRCGGDVLAAMAKLGARQPRVKRDRQGYYTKSDRLLVESVWWHDLGGFGYEW